MKPRHLKRPTPHVPPRRAALSPSVHRAWQRLLAAALLAPAPALALDRYEGTAHSTRDGRLLYRETHFRYEERGKPARLVLYRCANGTPFERKQVWSGAEPSAPDFEFHDARDGYARACAARRQARGVCPGRTGAKVRSKHWPAGQRVIDAGFDAFVRSNGLLARGEKVTASFLLPSRQAFLGVGIRKIEAPTGAQSKGQLRLRMNLDAWYGFAVPQTTLTYLADDRWLLRFEGIGTIRDAQGRNQEVRIEFPPRLRVASAPRADLDAALKAPLQGQCRA